MTAKVEMKIKTRRAQGNFKSLQSVYEILIFCERFVIEIECSSLDFFHRKKKVRGSGLFGPSWICQCYTLTLYIALRKLHVKIFWLLEHSEGGINGQ